MKIRFFCLFVVFVFCVVFEQARAQQPLHTTSMYQLYRDKVSQGDFVAKALSQQEIHSSYESPANEFLSPRISFKFSINGRDNEMVSGRDHYFNCSAQNGICETPPIKFGEQLRDDAAVPEGTYLKPESKLKIRLDMRDVFKQFDTKGYYELFNGNRLYKQDFKAVYVAGNIPPLTWDFVNLHENPQLELKDHDGDHIYEVTLTVNAKTDKRSIEPVWKLSHDLSTYPSFTSDYKLIDALYNMSLEEMIKAIEKDSTLRTGKEWAGVWTRDVSYSIILSMAILQPKVAQYSLMRKVKNGLVIQDTGTGGAYPVSTDRMIWAVAAWEIYQVTGEDKWLKHVYPIIKKSLEQDLLNTIDLQTNLVKGESSFLDWREQTYPSWMQPADIYESQCLGTNAAHYQAHVVLAKMAKLLNEPVTAAKHDAVAERIKTAVNTKLWLSDKGYYGQYLYGRNYKSLSSKSEALGEALCILFDIADKSRQASVARNTPINEFGIPCIYPQIPNIPPYHNNGIWPFVQAYWTLASAKAGNEKGVVESLSAIYRPAALFLTNKENFVASTGDFVGTQINSDNMLWSLSGQLAMVYKLFFGMHYTENGILLRPFVPKAFNGSKTLTNFSYRKAILDFELSGFGNVIKSITLDGKAMKAPYQIPSTLVGKHKVKIILANNDLGGEVNKPVPYVTLTTPEASMEQEKLTWHAVEGAHHYLILKNGSVISNTSATTYSVTGKTSAEFQVVAVDKKGVESFASEPVLFVPTGSLFIVEAEDHEEISERESRGFTGKGFIETSLSINPSIIIPVNIQEDGLYAIDVRYANGNGPINTENKCGIRNLNVNNSFIGVLVFPQRGTNEWSNWGYTNSIIVPLPKGKVELRVSYERNNLNMNQDINEAIVDHIRLVKIN